MDAFLALMDGRLEGVLELAETMRARGEKAGVAGMGELWALQPRYRARLYRGDPLAANESGTGSGPLVSPLRCLLLAHYGKKEEALKILEENVVKRPLKDETRIMVDTLFLEAAVLVGYRLAAELLLNRLNVPNLYTTGISVPTCIIPPPGWGSGPPGKI